MSVARSVTLLLTVFLVSPASVSATETRCKVALLDGTPIYHWRVFKSRYSDDVDRALVLREFKREGFVLPDRFVEKALQNEIAEKYHGDKASFEQSLQRSGASIAEYKQFLAEELTLAAFPKFIAKRSKEPDSLAAAHLVLVRTVREMS